MPTLSEMFFGSSDVKPQSGMTSQQRRIFGDLMKEVRNLQRQYGPVGEEGSSYLQGLFDPNNFQALEAPAMRQFQEQIVPSIAERFSGMGSGSRSSSGFRNQLGRAGVDLATNLAALRQQGQMQALPLSFQMAQTPLNMQQSLLGMNIGSGNIARAPMPGAIGPILQALGMAGGAFFGGPGGAALGSSIGSGLGSLFGGGS